MSHLILPCKWQTVRPDASIATTDHVATAGVSASGRTCTPIHRLVSRTIAVPQARHRPCLAGKVEPNSFSSTRMNRVYKSFQSLVLGCILLVSGALVQSLSAQDGKRSDAPYLGASEVAFEWQYSCINGKACSFSCPGSGGASNVTKLTLQ